MNESGRDQYWTVVPSDGNLLTSSLFSTTTLRVKSSFRVLMNEKKMSQKTESQLGKVTVLLVSKLESIVGILLESQRRPGESGL